MTKNFFCIDIVDVFVRTGFAKSDYRMLKRRTMLLGDLTETKCVSQKRIYLVETMTS